MNGVEIIDYFVTNKEILLFEDAKNKLEINKIFNYRPTSQKIKNNIIIIIINEWSIVLIILERTYSRENNQMGSTFKQKKLKIN